MAQSHQNRETVQGLGEAVDRDQIAKAVAWDRVLQLQSAFLRISLERTTEITQTVVTAAASAIRREAQKAA